MHICIQNWKKYKKRNFFSQKFKMGVKNAKLYTDFNTSEQVLKRGRQNSDIQKLWENANKGFFDNHIKCLQHIL